MLNVFKDRCLNLGRCETVLSEMNHLSTVSLDKWIMKRDISVLKKMDAEAADIYNWRDYMTYFKLMVKKEAKVKLDQGCLTKHNPAQNIIFHQKFINAVYGPIFADLMSKIRLCVNENIVIFTEMNLQQLADKLYFLLGGKDVYHKGEIDFSKYDKSQDYYLKRFELRLYEFFGFDREFLECWSWGEYHCHAASIHNDMSFRVTAQRRSGAANTFLGNTLINLAVLAMHYDLPKFQAVVVAGDDSILFRKSEIYDAGQRITMKYGLDAKFIKDQPPYFCSKFIVFCDDKIYVVPDPYKLIVKFGKPLTTTDYAEIKEKFISFQDLTIDYHRESVIQELTKAVNIRYKCRGYYTYSALCALHCLGANFTKYLELYPISFGWIEVAAAKMTSFLYRNYAVYDRSYCGADSMLMLEATKRDDFIRMPNLNGYAGQGQEYLDGTQPGIFGFENSKSLTLSWLPSGQRPKTPVTRGVSTLGVKSYRRYHQHRGDTLKGVSIWFTKQPFKDPEKPISPAVLRAVSRRNPEEGTKVDHDIDLFNAAALAAIGYDAPVRNRTINVAKNSKKISNSGVGYFIKRADSKANQPAGNRRKILQHVRKFDGRVT